MNLIGKFMISLIIPTYNAETYLPNLLEQLEQQTIQGFELLIIDSSSSDRTVEILSSYTEEIYIIPQDEFDHAGTRTKAAELAQGDILIYLTQDALPADTDAIERLIAPFRDLTIGATYGRQLPYPESTLFSQHLRYFNYPDDSYTRSIADIPKFGYKTAFLSDSFAAYRKSALHEVDYFGRSMIVGEDVYVGSKLLEVGYKLAYISEAEVYHSHNYTPLEEFKRYFDIGVFHALEPTLLEKFGKTEGEGFKYIKSEYAYLLEHKAYLLLPLFLIRNGLKFLGYKLGKLHKKLPKSVLPYLSMHHKWWSKHT
jgi:rhamnosyltransferase